MSTSTSHLENHLRRHFGRYVKNIEQHQPLDSWLAVVLRDAARHDFVSDQAKTAYVCVAATNGQCFMEEDWVVKICHQIKKPDECIHLIAAESLKRIVNRGLSVSQKNRAIQQAKPGEKLFKEVYERYADWLWQVQSQYHLSFSHRGKLYNWFKKFIKNCNKYDFNRFSEVSILLEIYLSSESSTFYEDAWAKYFLEADESSSWRIMGLRSCSKQRVFERYVEACEKSVIEDDSTQRCLPYDDDLDNWINHYAESNYLANKDLDFERLSIGLQSDLFDSKSTSDHDFFEKLKFNTIKSMQCASVLGVEGELTLKALGAASLFQGVVDYVPPWVRRCLVLPTDSLRAQAIKYYLESVMRYKLRDAALLARADFDKTDYLKYDDFFDSKSTDIALDEFGKAWSIVEFSERLFQRIQKTWPESVDYEDFSRDYVDIMIVRLVSRFNVYGLSMLASAVTLGVLTEQRADELPAIMFSLDRHNNENWHPILCNNDIGRYYAQRDAKFWDTLIS